MKSITKLAATLTLAITLTLTACEEKKKQDGTTTTATEPSAEAATQQPATQEAVAEKPAENATATETETASESQPSGGEDCPKGEPPKTIEAVFLENDDSNSEDLEYSDYRLTNGEEIRLNGFAPDDVKKGDKVYVTYKVDVYKDFSDQCSFYYNIISMKKIEQ